MRRLFVILAFAALAFVPLASGSGQLKPGSLDPSFGKNGIATAAVGSASGARAVALQTDGKIVAAGQASLGHWHDAFALVRYLRDGSIDLSFGKGGTVTTDFGASEGIAFGVTVQPDGKTIGVGGFEDSPGDFLLARYLPDGSLDPTFGTDGKVVTPISQARAANAVAVQPNGKILAAGGRCSSCGGPYYGSDFALVRYNPDGSLDQSFGKGGIVTTDFGADEGVNAFAILPGGKILAAGGSEEDVYGCNCLALARYEPNGSLDPSFGIDGKELVSVIDPATGLALQGPGRFLVTGWTLARFKRDGTLDRSFGTNGIRPDFVNQYAQLAVQPDGKIVSGGTREWRGTRPLAVAAARYLPDGAWDRSFGKDGRITTSIGTRNSFGFGLALQRNGKIVVAGWGADRPLADFAAVRYLGSICTVPRLTGKTVKKAERMIRRSDCSVGRIRRAFSRSVHKGRVISQQPRAHTTHPAGTKVSLVVSKGAH